MSGGVAVNERHIEVLDQYELEVEAVKKGRGAWICETGQGLKMLREYKGTVKRLEFEERVLTFVQEQGYSFVDRYIRNKEGELISIADDGTRYIVKDWFADRECNLKDQYEIMNATAKIAVLHKLFRQIPFEEEWNMGSILSESPELEMERHNKELRRARNYISHKRKKTEFELCVIGNYHLFYEQAQEALEGMRKLCGCQEKPSLFLCHGDLDQHHILMGSHYIALTEFNKMHLGIQMMDLYHFTRKVMEKHDWNLNLGLSMLEAYQSILPMNEADKNYLYYLFLYPEKYWKQINFYYNANKAWIPARNIEKLKSLEEQQESRNRFLSKIK